MNNGLVHINFPPTLCWLEGITRARVKSKVFDVTPVPAPRQVRRDIYDPSPSVLRYRAYQDEIRLKQGSFTFPAATAAVQFFLPIPKSNRDSTRVPGSPHQQTPDFDNLLKALLDSLIPPFGKKDDSYIYQVIGIKRWTEHGNGRIVINYLDIEDESRGS